MPGSASKEITLVAVLLIAPALAGCAALGGEGTATVFVKDTHIDEFESIEVTFDQVTIHEGDDGSEMSGAQHGTQGGADGRPDTSAAGWTVVFEGTKTIDLLDYNQSDSRAFLGQANLSAGTYNQIVIDVVSVTGTRSDGSTEDFTVTTGWARVAGSWQVQEGEDTRLILDINLENSVVKQGTGDWRFNPVIGRVIQEQGDGSTSSRPDSAGDGGDGTGGDGGTGSQTTYVKDAASDEFKEVWIRFDWVQVHAANNDSWVTVYNGSRALDLMAFNETGSKAFLGEAELDAGRYTQIRINVTESWGIDNDDNNVTITVTQTSAKIARSFQINENETTQVTIDIALDQSLHKQGQQGWRLTPNIGRVVVQENARNDPRSDQADTGEGSSGDGGSGSQTTYVKDRPTHNFSEVWVEFDQVEVHFAGNESWITVFNGSRALDLLRFNETGSKAFLGDANLSVGRYTQIRINVTDAWGVNNTGGNESFDLVDTEYKVAGTWNISANQTTQVVIDIDLDNALHKKGGPGGQGDQGWQFTPVIGRILVTEDIDTDPRGDVPDQAEA